MTQLLLPDLPGFSIEQITLTNGLITVLAQSQTMQASCPVCASLSSRVHSRYERTLSDLPWSGHTVRLAVQVRRFLCQQPTCPERPLRKAFLPSLSTMLAGPFDSKRCWRGLLWLSGENKVRVSQQS